MSPQYSVNEKTLSNVQSKISRSHHFVFVVVGKLKPRRHSGDFIKNGYELKNNTLRKNIIFNTTHINSNYCDKE